MIIIKVTIEDNRYIILESKPDNLDKIEELFTFKDSSNCFVNGRYVKENIETRKLLVKDPKNPTMSLLPIGFLKDLEDYLKENGAKYKIFDQRKIQHEYNFTRDQIKNCLGYLTLDKFQIDIVQTCLKHTMGIIKAPTGSGKTECFIALCKLMNIKTLILFARIDLAHQTLRRMIKAGLDGGIVQGSNIDENHKIVMATVQSSHKLRDKYEMVIVDEVHRANSEAYHEILMANMFRYRFGFSATPFVYKDKYKDARTKSWIGGLIYEVESEPLIESGRIAKPTIHMIPVDRPENIFDKKWQAAENWGIVENTYRNKIIAKLCETLGGQILILVKRIDHGKNLEKRISNSQFLHGDIKVKDRQEVAAKFENDGDFVLIASTIFDEGIDILNVNHVIIAGGGSSYIKVIQRMGRGMRAGENKKEVDIYDFYDQTNNILMRHSNERIRIYKKNGFKDIKVMKDDKIKTMLLR